MYHNHMDKTFLEYQTWLLPCLSLKVKLSKDDLLQKCLHGKKQNQNGSLKEMVWQRIPKEILKGAIKIKTV